MSLLDECLGAAIPHARARYGIGPGADPYRGLYIGDDMVDRLIVESLECRSLGEDAAGSWPQLLTDWCDEPLDPFETATVLLALAPEVDLKYERIYGYLQDDVNARRPRVSLALDLFCRDLPDRLAARDRFSPDAVLRRERILTLDGSGDEPLLSRRMRLEPQLIRHLMGGTGLDERVAQRCQVLLPDLEMPHVPLDADNRASIQALVDDITAGHAVRVALAGSDLEVLSELAAELARAAQMPMLRVEAADDSLIRLISNESRLLGYAIHVEWPQSAGPPARTTLETLNGAGDVVIVTTDRSSHDFAATGLSVIDIGEPDAALRRQWWERCAPGLSDSDFDRLAARYRLTGSEIRASSRAARRSSVAVRPDRSPDAVAFANAALRHSRHRLEGLARRVEPIAGWDDLVLPANSMAALRELCDRIAHRQTVLRQWGMGRCTNHRMGVNALFAGASGTGKTMAAQIIAGELGLDLFVVNLSTVVDKYIGETEKNLEMIFTAAERADAVVFFDEADSLCGKRSEVSDAHDRYANLEISYLLQRMEAHDGIALLATNLRQNIDDAFLRRLNFLIRFPFPEEAERRRIWSQIWPETVPIDVDVDINSLAQCYRFSGGNIRNIAVCAAFLAAANERAVSWEHIMTAIDREYEKLGGGADLATSRLTAASG
ncbi:MULTISPECIES: ATP-binding protein [unclassified Mycobacterium]|uniref:ATP-binding protein n=1 Tax=unclassified Mycobacterium TaxID=2642494 RepID=UPI00114D46D3|nr:MULTISPECIES: ATP-binding protein [unclassified Mycobacterium]